MRMIVVSSVLLSITSALQFSKRADAVAYNNPKSGGGSMLTIVSDTFPAGLGEPLNIIISGESDPRVLGDYFSYFAYSIGFSPNCLGAQADSKQEANLGDGKGAVNETNVLRWNYGDPNFGSCKETVDGGNHFRYWQQADTNAIFLAASIEQPLSQGHDIESPDGYDAGRDQVVGNATVSSGTSFRNVSFYTTATQVTGLLQSGSDNINHGLSIDGVVYLLNVTLTDLGSDPIGSSSTAAPIRIPGFFTLLILTIAYFISA